MRKVSWPGFRCASQGSMPQLLARAWVRNNVILWYSNRIGPSKLTDFIVYAYALGCVYMHWEHIQSTPHETYYSWRYDIKRVTYILWYCEYVDVCLPSAAYSLIQPLTVTYRQNLAGVDRLVEDLSVNHDQKTKSKIGQRQSLPICYNKQTNTINIISTYFLT